MPRVSIIIPAHNAEAYLAEAAKSALCQEGCDIELIIVNDGSSDNTPDIMSTLNKNHPTIKLLHLPKNLGVSEARNRGAKIATSDYLLFLDSDDILVPNSVITLYNPIAKSEHSAAMGRFNIIDKYGEKIADCTGGKDKNHIFSARDVLLGRRFFNMAQLLLKKEAFILAKQFDPTLSYAEDKSFVLFLALSGKILLIDEIVLHYRRHEQSAMNRFHLQKSAFECHRKIFADPEFNRRFSKPEISYIKLVSYSRIYKKIIFSAFRFWKRHGSFVREKNTQ